MNLNPIVLSIPIYFFLIGVELIVQWFSSRKIYRLNDALTNISCGILQQLTGLFLRVLSVTIYVIVFESIRIFTIPNNWLTITALFFLVDLCYYWAHRMSHEINLFWGGHVVHHQSEDYNFSVALHQGSFQVIWTFAFYLPLALLGFDPTTFVLISALNTVYQFWIHTETIGKLGPLEWIFNTPSHHRVHHGRNPKYIDKNHAGVFIIWDRMFGTFQEEEETPTYGITSPTNSWNPVWVNLKHYVEMAGWLRKARTFKDRWGILFNKPGWFPDYMGGYQAPPEVNKDGYIKYDHQTTRKRGTYVFVQYLIALGGTAFFLFNVSNFDVLTQVSIVILVILAITVCGGILDDRPWALRFEYLRIVLTVIGVIYFFLYPSTWYFYLIPVSIGLATIIWFQKIRQ
jgi:sterol desaturase/sphingolipid hydroxylase (fatty acid hydroxylase superfamily)